MSKSDDKMLLPCPFCGDESVMLMRSDVTNKWRAFCGSCQATQNWHFRKATTIINWNRRAKHVIAASAYAAGRAQGRAEGVIDGLVDLGTAEAAAERRGYERGRAEGREEQRRIDTTAVLKLIDEWEKSHRNKMVFGTFWRCEIAKRITEGDSTT